MYIYYNPTGIGDVLIFPIEEGDRYDIQTETFGPITKIMNSNKKVLGYNIFHASKYMPLPNSGKIPLNKQLLAEIKQLFQTFNLEDPLELDVSPKFVVGYVKEKTPHENADKLSVCQVDIGEECLQIVCGAPNVEKGQKVVVARIGAIMPSGLKIKPSKLRGIPSNGMICSMKELGLPGAPEEKGIYVLDDSYMVGEPFIF